ncbi:MAG: carbohydrate kinase family protein [Chloroflexi bacterium]|nr:MAG: carbohydrate kinase family protein [Chloroflexota bacterium]
MFITCGGMRIDYLITHEGEARVGEVGGNALYAAVGAALWSDEVGLWARIGANYPQAWLDRLRKTGFGIDGLVRIPGHQDHRTFFAYRASGPRDDTNPAAHFARIGQPLPEALSDYVHSTPGQDDPHNFEPLAVRPDDWPEAYDGVTAVHLSPISLATHLSVPPLLRQRGVQQICCDPGERYMVPDRQTFIQQLLRQIDVFLPSAMEVRSLFGNDVDLRDAAKTLCRWGATVVVVKNGKQGVLVQEGENGRSTHIPAYHKYNDSRIIDVTGAGDSFCGGFMVGLSQTADPVQAARMGAVTSSLVIEGYGALYALSRRGEENGRLETVNKKQSTEIN